MRILSVLALVASSASCGSLVGESRDVTDGSAPPVDGDAAGAPDAENAGDVAQFGPTKCARAGQHGSFRVTGASTASCATAEGLGAEHRDPMTVTGRVTSVTATSFTIDSCPPGANCLVASTTTVEISAPDLLIPLQLGELVEVEYLITRFYACQQALEVRSVVPEPTVLLVLVDGGSAFADSPYQVTRQPLPECRVDAGAACGVITPGAYALIFSPKFTSEPSLSLATGETQTALLQPMVARALVVHNLRSYQTEQCDDYWNFAYTMHATAR